jgi:hypothetical protein
VVCLGCCIGLLGFTSLIESLYLLVKRLNGIISPFSSASRILDIHNSEKKGEIGEIAARKLYKALCEAYVSAMPSLDASA